MSYRSDTEHTSGKSWVALVEVAVFLIIALGSRQLLMPVAWKFAGPITLIGTLVLLTVYMRFRGLKWSQMGLKSLPGVKSKLLVIPQAFLVFIIFTAAMAFMIEGLPAMGLAFMGEVPQGVDDRWGDIEGNLHNYLLWIGIVWVSAAFGEEMFFRGFLITRLQAGLKGIPFAAALSIIIPALIFGFGHMYYQGLRGFIVTGVVALIFGTFFLLYRRNLWPLILFHGAFDSLVITAIYLGLDA